MKQGNFNRLQNTCHSNNNYKLLLTIHSEIYFSWLTGLRLLIEGSVIDPYIFGDQGFWQVISLPFAVFIVIVQVVQCDNLHGLLVCCGSNFTQPANCSVQQEL